MLIVVKLKSPDIIFFPICLINSHPTPLSVSIATLSVKSIPLPSFPVSMASTFSLKNLKYY